MQQTQRKNKDRDKKKQQKWNHGTEPTNNNSQQHKPAAFASKTFNPNTSIGVKEPDTRPDQAVTVQTNGKFYISEKFIPTIHL